MDVLRVWSCLACRLCVRELACDAARCVCLLCIPACDSVRCARAAPRCLALTVASTRQVRALTLKSSPLEFITRQARCSKPNTLQTQHAQNPARTKPSMHKTQHVCTVSDADTPRAGSRTRRPGAEQGASTPCVGDVSLEMSLC
eukprot:30586-Rhodomonas_salina.2